MNTTTRRLATAAAGVALAASAVATTGPAAFAGKPGAADPQPLVMSAQSESDIFWVDYSAPVRPSAVKSVACSSDGVAMADCGFLQPFDGSAAVWSYTHLGWDGYSTGEHTLTFTVTTRKATYTGSVQVYAP